MKRLYASRLSKGFCSLSATIFYARQLLVGAVVGMASFLLFSCGNSAGEETVAAQDTGDAAMADAALVDDAFYQLYLRRGQVDTLATLAQMDKIVFQVYNDSAGRLTLYAWPAKKNSKEFDAAHVQQLVISGVKVGGISRNDLMLGNLQVGTNILQGLLSDTAIKLVTFTPVVDSRTTDPKRLLNYVIEGAQIIPTETKEALTGTRLNPSPPKQVEEM